MAEYLTQNTTVEMPHVLGLEALGLARVHQLAEESVDAIAEATEKGTPIQQGGGIDLLPRHATPAGVLNRSDMSTAHRFVLRIQNTYDNG